MHSIFMVIVNNGDGSSGIEWRRTMDDGIQVHELKFETKESMLSFIRLNVHFGFYEEQEEDE